MKISITNKQINNKFLLLLGIRQERKVGRKLERLKLQVFLREVEVQKIVHQHIIVQQVKLFYFLFYNNLFLFLEKGVSPVNKFSAASSGTKKK